MNKFFQPSKILTFNMQYAQITSETCFINNSVGVCCQVNSIHPANPDDLITLSASSIKSGLTSIPTTLHSNFFAVFKFDKTNYRTWYHVSKYKPLKINDLQGFNFLVDDFGDVFFKIEIYTNLFLSILSNCLRGQYINITWPIV